MHQGLFRNALRSSLGFLQFALSASNSRSEIGPKRHRRPLRRRLAVSMRHCDGSEIFLRQFVRLSSPALNSHTLRAVAVACVALFPAFGFADGPVPTLHLAPVLSGLHRPVYVTNH